MMGKCEKMKAMVKAAQPYMWLPLRIVLGIIFIAHGCDKLWGCFGGGGFWETARAFEGLGLQPGWFHAALGGGGELVGGFLVLTGFMTRFGAMLIAATMLVAIVMVHGPNGLFAKNGGFEYPLTLFAAALTLMIAGGGKVFSADAKCCPLEKESAAGDACSL